MKYFLAPIFLLLLIGHSPGQSQTTDAHLREAGTASICLRSAFAHGYRHGYDEGYHWGNIDINMGRHPRTRLQEFHGISSGYSSEFGPRKYFESGFQDGLKAGYGDGFVGRKFRAIANLHLISEELDKYPSAANSINTSFDQGLSAGYSRGFGQVRQDQAWESNCTGFLSLRQTQDATDQASFCDGYIRGYQLGRDDGLISGHEGNALAAKK